MAVVAALFIVATHQAPPTSLADCINRDFAAYEKVLRMKPERNVQGIGEDRIYRTARNGTISLTKRAGSKIVNQVSIMMPRGSKRTWKELLSFYGLSPIGATARKTARGRYTIITRRALPSGWAVEWNPGRESDGFDQLTVWQPIHVIY